MSEAIVDYVEVIQDDDGQYRVRAKASNGETVWTSEQYKARHWAEKVAQDTGKPIKVRD